MNESVVFDPSSVFCVLSSDLATLGLLPGDTFRILPLSADYLFDGDLVVAIVQGFRCMGQLHPGRSKTEVKIAVPLPKESGQPQQIRVVYTPRHSVIGLVICDSPLQSH